jgi:hypothetical protein
MDQGRGKNTTRFFLRPSSVAPHSHCPGVIPGPSFRGWGRSAFGSGILWPSGVITTAGGRKPSGGAVKEQFDQCGGHGHGCQQFW